MRLAARVTAVPAVRPDKIPVGAVEPPGDRGDEAGPADVRIAVHREAAGLVGDVGPILVHRLDPGGVGGRRFGEAGLAVELETGKVVTGGTHVVLRGRECKAATRAREPVRCTRVTVQEGASRNDQGTLSHAWRRRPWY